MKFILSILILCSIAITAQSHNFMTYNIRYANDHDGDNKWDLRREKVASQIKFYEPEVIGLQEALESQVQYLDKQLSDYKFVGVGRDDGKTKGEYAPIYYKEEQLKLVEWSFFWLSDTPEKVSVGWDAALPRICTYALFEDNGTKEKFWVFNTHFDHQGETARLESSKLIYKKISEINSDNSPVILMGDFNLEPESSSIKFLSKKFNDTFSYSKLNYGSVPTFNGFKSSKTPEIRIDYIFTSKTNVKVNKYAVFSDLIDQKYNSDHFPVYVEVEFIK